MHVRSGEGVRDTRVFGASVLLAEGASQKPLKGSEHAARKDLMILKVTAFIWRISAALSR